MAETKQLVLTEDEVKFLLYVIQDIRYKQSIWSPEALNKTEHIYYKLRLLFENGTK